MGTRSCWSPPQMPINESLFGKLNFNFIRDTAPIATIHRGIGVMVVNSSFPQKFIAEFIDAADFVDSIGQGLPLQLRWQYVRCTPDNCTLDAPPNSAALG